MTGSGANGCSVPGAYVAHEPEFVEGPDDVPAEVDVAGTNAHPRGSGQRVVVVVETLPERQHAEDPHVGPALGGILDREAALTEGVRDVTDRPVTQDPSRGAKRDHGRDRRQAQ